MAIRVEFDGWIKEIRQFDWGVVYVVSHAQRRKNHQGEWETEDYDYLDVSGDPGFQVDDRIRVTGNLKTKRYDKKDGSGKGIALQVRSETITKVERDSQGRPVFTPVTERNSHVNPAHQATLNKVTASVPDMQQVWPALKQVPDDTPF
jgi:RPA family protein